MKKGRRVGMKCETHCYSTIEVAKEFVEILPMIIRRTLHILSQLVDCEGNVWFVIFRYCPKVRGIQWGWQEVCRGCLQEGL